MKEGYILSIDQGTTSSRVVLFNHHSQIIAISQKEVTQIYPKTGWVEHNPIEILGEVIEAIKDLFIKTGISPLTIKAIGITNQRETTIVWNKTTGQPIYNAIVWQDTRTSDICEQMKVEGWEEYVKVNTGLIIDSYFSASKVKWILDNVEGAKEQAINGNLLCGTMDSWLIWNLTKERNHFTDFSNASRTMLFNIKTLEWDKKILNYFDIPFSMLPEVKASSYVYGNINLEIFNGENIPIAGVAGDQQAALFGHRCFESGMTKNTYGTGCFMLMNTGSKIVKSENGLLTTIAWCINDKVEYALEGSIFITGAVIQWLRDNLKIINNSSETQSIAESIPDTSGVYFVPAFSGLGTPYWDMYARGAIVGLTRGVGDKEIIRAALESIAYQTRDVLSIMEQDAALTIPSLKVDGGVTSNDFLMQFQADILNLKVEKPKVIETTALGAAYLAGLCTQFWNIRDLQEIEITEKVFLPNMDELKKEKLYNGWKYAVKQLLAK
ncbi:MAG: glycerol kinase [Bacteroidetes bacterium CG2_30_32_10]|nr:MAG: glycerol kinase [Bacteroidetes bacterium CG2_30_32_10]